MKRIFAIVAVLGAGLVGVAVPVPASATGQSIVGTVRDSNLVPIEGATVTRAGPGICPFSCAVVTTTTAANGTYSFPSSPETSYIMTWTPPANRPDLVQVWSGGVLGAFRNGVPAPYAPIFTVLNGEAVVDAVLPFGGTISGHVVWTGGHPAAGARVQATFDTADGPVGPPIGPTATVDADGNYTLTGLPANAGLFGPGAAYYTLAVVPPFQNVPVPGLVLPATGQFEIFPGTTISGADAVIPGAPPISGTASIFQGGVKLTKAALPSTTTGAGLCVAPALFDPSTFCANPPPSIPTFTTDGTQLIGPLAPGTYTVRGIQAFVSGSPLSTTVTVGAGESFHCLVPLDSSITPQCFVSSTGSPTADGDGASTAAEDAAPNHGDGNGDGVPDSTQPSVASMPDPTGGYVTAASADGYALSNVTVTDPASLPGPLPSDLDVHTGVVGYSVAVPNPGDSATINLYVDDPTATLNRAWKIQGGAALDASTLVSAFTPLGDGRTRVTINLTDGGFGDADASANGTIQDPVGLGIRTIPPYSFTGFRPPIDNAPVVNSVKAGSTVPVKWRLTTAAGAAIADPASFESIKLAMGGCPSNPGLDEIEVLVSTTGLSYKGSGEWQYNWKTAKTLRGCGVMQLRLADGSLRTARFDFR